MEPKPMHPALEPVKFLIGKWRSKSAKGKYPPRVEPFTYCEEIEFESLGQPMLNYKSTSWNPNHKQPMHLESGFLKINTESPTVTLIAAHNFGVASIEEGAVANGVLHLTSAHITRATQHKEPAVTEIERHIELKDTGELEIKTAIATTKSELSDHLVVVYERIN